MRAANAFSPGHAVPSELGGSNWGRYEKTAKLDASTFPFDACPAVLTFARAFKLASVLLSFAISDLSTDAAWGSFTPTPHHSLPGLSGDQAAKAAEAPSWRPLGKSGPPRVRDRG